MKHRYIAIEGNIGSGKTTLAKMLADRYDADLVLEQFEDNEFLPRFYADPARYAFPVEMTFLAERYGQLNRAHPGESLFAPLTISDYFLSKSLIFAASNLQEDELRLFRKVFDIMFRKITKPDLLVYLYSTIDRLQENIRIRGRRYEQNISSKYLRRIQNRYLDFLHKQSLNTPVMIIDVSKIDFVNDEQAFEEIVDTIRRSPAKGLHHRVIIG